MTGIQKAVTGSRGIPVRFIMLIVIFAMGLTACSRQPPDTADAQIDVPGDQLSVRNAYMPALVPGRQMGVVYLELNNASRRDRELILLETTVAESAEVHRSFYEDGTMRMRKIQHLSVPAGQSLRFEPGGYHIMLMQAGDVPEPPGSFDLRMVFDGGEAIDVPVQVRDRQ